MQRALGRSGLRRGRAGTAAARAGAFAAGALAGVLLAAACLPGAVRAEERFSELHNPPALLEPPVPYRPMYFLSAPYTAVGPNEAAANSKFQISLQKDVLTLPWLGWPLIFAYSQIALWDVGTGSSPLGEVNYNPELFVRIGDCPDPYADCAVTHPGSRIPRTAWVVGGDHESNGLAGDASRSWSRAYGTFKFSTNVFPALDFFEDWIEFKAWTVYGRDHTNWDIESYSGWFELTVRLRSFGIGWDTALRKGSGGRFRVVSDASGPLPWGLKALWHVQYMNGWGQTLQQYNVREEQWRFGVMLFR